MIVYLERPFHPSLCVRIEDPERITLHDLGCFLNLNAERNKESAWYSFMERALLDPEILLCDLPVADQDRLLVFEKPQS